MAKRVGRSTRNMLLALDVLHAFDSWIHLQENADRRKEGNKLLHLLGSTNLQGDQSKLAWDILHLHVLANGYATAHNFFGKFKPSKFRQSLQTAVFAAAMEHASDLEDWSAAGLLSLLAQLESHGAFRPNFDNLEIYTFLAVQLEESLTFGQLIRPLHQANHLLYAVDFLDISSTELVCMLKEGARSAI